MKHGDISNQKNFIVAVRLEDTLLKKRGNKITGIVDMLFHTDLSYSIDDDVLSLVQYIYRRTDYTVLLVVDKKAHISTSDFMELFPFAILAIDNESEISMKLLTGDITYYIDDDDYRRSLVNNKYAVSYEEFNTILKRKAR